MIGRDELLVLMKDKESRTSTLVNGDRFSYDGLIHGFLDWLNENPTTMASIEMISQMKGDAAAVAFCLGLGLEIGVELSEWETAGRFNKEEEDAAS